MFGYVIIDKPNILIKDFQTYRSYYCGLCKRIGNNYGQLMRMTVNYDIVLLSLLLHNYEKVVPIFEEERCIAHPIGKKVPVAKSNDILDKVVHINTILGYYKVVDNVIDEGKNKTIKLLLKPKFNKAKKLYPELCDFIDKKYNQLRYLENQNCYDENMLADCFGEIMKAIAEASTKKADDNLKNLCYNLGKWIYFIDAIDDIREDALERKFNPFITKGKVIDDEFFNQRESSLRYLLYSTIEKIIESYDKMDITISEGALSNIIYLGLKARTEEVIKRRGKCQKMRL